MPSAGDQPGTVVDLVSEADGRWLAVAVLLFLASVSLLLGLPAVLRLFVPKVRLVGYAAITTMVVAATAIAGYATVLVFFRALVLSGALTGPELSETLADRGLGVFLSLLVLSFHLGEALVATTLLRAGTIHRWVPVVLLAHAATLPLAGLFPEGVRDASLLLMMVGMCAIAIESNALEARLVQSGPRVSPGT